MQSYFKSHKGTTKNNIVDGKGNNKQDVSNNNGGRKKVNIKQMTCSLALE